ncbi:hypothetical protein Tco_0204319 [Tanacetum coccineum]
MYEEVQNTRGNMRTNSRASTLTCSKIYHLLQRLDFGTKSSNLGRLWHPAAATVETMGFAAATATVAAKWVAKDTTPSLASTLIYPVTNIIGVEPCGFNGRSIGIDVPVCLGLTLVKQIQFHLSQITGVLGVPQETSYSRSTYFAICITISPTIRRTARISIPHIEPSLAERSRISAINLDDYQLDPITPPPSPSSPFTMAAYQRMIAETDPTQREEALTETGQNSVPVPETALTVCTTRLRGQLHTILEDMDRYPNSCLEELEAFMTLWDVKPRVEESSLEALSVDELITQLRQLCEDAEDRASNAQEEA